MNEEKQPIQGASLLDSIIKMFFGGLDKILDSAAQYEEEMGILKQISNIPVTGKDGKDYTLTIKLSPVRGKDNTFYVEAGFDTDKYNASSIDKQVVRIDNSNKKDFQQLVLKVIHDNGLQEANDFGDLDVDVSEEESESTTDNSSEVDDLIAEAKQQTDKGILAQGEGVGLVSINVEYEKSDDSKTCRLHIDASADRKVITSIPASDFSIDLEDDNGDLISFNAFYQEVTDCVDEFISKNNLTGKQYIPGSTRVEAKFIKASKTNEIELSAITANCDIKKAMNIIYDVTDNDSFVDMLPDDKEVSFAIVDQGADYDVQEIDNVDTTGVFLDIFKNICMTKCILQTYQWATGSRNWDADTFLSSCDWPIQDLLQETAVWVINHTNKYPTIISAFGNDFTELEDVKIDGVVSIDLVKDQVVLVLEGLKEMLDIYYVDLDHSEQHVVDGFLNDITRMLTYAS